MSDFVSTFMNISTVLFSPPNYQVTRFGSPVRKKNEMAKETLQFLWLMSWLLLIRPDCSLALKATVQSLSIYVQLIFSSVLLSITRTYFMFLPQHWKSLESH